MAAFGLQSANKDMYGKIEQHSPRPAMSMFILWAPPHRAEPRAKKAMKTSRMGLRPNIDTSPPTRGSTAVEAIVYALPTQMKFIPLR